MTDAPVPESKTRNILSEIPPPGGVDIISGTGFGPQGAYDEDPDDPDAWRRAWLWRALFKLNSALSPNGSANRARRARSQEPTA